MTVKFLNKISYYIFIAFRVNKFNNEFYKTGLSEVLIKTFISEGYIEKRDDCPFLRFYQVTPCLAFLRGEIVSHFDIKLC